MAKKINTKPNSREQEELKFAGPKPIAYGSLTKEQLDAELQKGLDSIKAGRVCSAEEVAAMMHEEFRI